MPLPRKGDPRRPLHLAVRSTRLLAIIFLFFGSLAVAPMLTRGGLARGPDLLVSLSIFLVYIAPGVAYLIFSIFLKRRQLWAVWADLILASIHLLITLIGAVTLIIVSLNTMNRIIALAPAAILGLIILALAQLIYHLALSFEAIKHVPPEESRGFEPLMVEPITPPTSPPGTTSSDNQIA